MAQNGPKCPKNGIFWGFLTFRTRNLGSGSLLDDSPALTEQFYAEKPQKPPHGGEIGHHARTLNLQSYFHDRSSRFIEIFIRAFFLPCFLTCGIKLCLRLQPALQPEKDRLDHHGH